MRSHSFEIKNTLRSGGAVPRLPYDAMARKVLGNRYELSLVLCGDALAKRINTKYRKKTYAPNVLSFPLGRYEGEIFLNVRKAAREARTYGVSLRERVALLFVHGLLHLAGMKHGATMENTEQKVLRIFRIVK